MKNKGFLYALSTALMFASMGTLVKFTYRHSVMNANLLFFTSSVISCLFFMTLLLIKHKNLSFLKINKKDLLVALGSGGLFGVFLANLAVLTSLQYVNVGIQTIITYSNPLFIVLINRFLFCERLTKRSIFNIFLIVSGLSLVVGNINFSGSNVSLGVMYAVLASIFVGSYSILSERIKVKIDQLQYWFYAFLGSTIYIVTYMSFAGEINLIGKLANNLNLELILLLVAVALINFAIPFVTFYKALTTIKAEKTNIILTLSPVLSTCLSCIIFSDYMQSSQIIGAGFIVLASLLSGRK